MWWEANEAGSKISLSIPRLSTFSLLRTGRDAATVLQRGVDLPSLDVTYFTSLSYYILLLFGLRGVFMLFFRDEVIDETQMMRQQMSGAANPMGNPDPQKAFEAEKSAFDLVFSDFSLRASFPFPRLGMTHVFAVNYMSMSIQYHYLIFLAYWEASSALNWCFGLYLNACNNEGSQLKFFKLLMLPFCRWNTSPHWKGLRP